MDKEALQLILEDQQQKFKRMMEEQQTKDDQKFKRMMEEQQTKFTQMMDDQQKKFTQMMEDHRGNSRPITPSPSPPIAVPYSYNEAANFMFFILEDDGTMSCVVAIDPNYLVTFRHGTHLKYRKYVTQLKIYHSSDQTRQNEYAVTVVDINKQLDFVLLRSERPIIRYPPPIAAPMVGEPIRVLGYGNFYNTLSNVTGSIHLGKVQYFRGEEIDVVGPYILAIAGTSPGDSGGSCWNQTGLVGINVSFTRMPIHLHNVAIDNAAIYNGNNCISGIDAIIDSMKSHKARIEIEKQKKRYEELNALVRLSTVLPLPDHMKLPPQDKIESRRSD